MAELVTIARPYAEAAFEVAKGAGRLGEWSDALTRLAAVSSAPELVGILGNPKLAPEKLANLLAESAAVTDPAQRRFVDLLAQGHRVGVLSEVLSSFTTLKDAHEQVLAAEVTSAFPLSDGQVAEIRAVLQQKYGKSVRVTVAVNPELIGGVTIRIGDEVMDTSVRGKLVKMAGSLTH